MEIKITQALDIKKFENLKDKKPILNAIGNHLINIVSKSFQNETSPSGNKWAENKESTKRKKRSSKILHDSGQLVLSIDYWTTENEVTVGTNKNYAAIHQFGGNAGRKNRVRIPPRPFLPIEDIKLIDNTKQEIIGIVINHIEKTIK